MRRSFQIVALAVTLLLLAPSTAAAQGVFGVSSGLILNAPAYNPAVCPAGACCGGTNLTVSAGTYYLLGSPFALSTSQASSSELYNTCGAVDGGAVGSCRQPPLEGGGAIADDTAYYCYQTSVPSLICTTTAPWPNGQPSALVTLPSTIQTQYIVFVGSFLTDPGGCIIPMTRIGEYVLLKPYAQTFVDAGLGATGTNYTFNGGVASCSWPQGGGGANNCRSLAGMSADSVAPFYPASASAGIFDVHVLNNIAQQPGGGGSPNDQLIQFYDPTSYFGGGVNGVQAEIGIGGASTTNITEAETERTTLNVNKLPPPYDPPGYYVGPNQNLGQFSINPAVPAANVSVIAVLRGYIEPIQRLWSR